MSDGEKWLRYTTTGIDKQQGRGNTPPSIHSPSPQEAFLDEDETSSSTVIYNYPDSPKRLESPNSPGIVFSRIHYSNTLGNVTMDTEEAVSCSLANIMNIINAIKPNNGDKTTQNSFQKHRISYHIRASDQN